MEIMNPGSPQIIFKAALPQNELDLTNARIQERLNIDDGTLRCTLESSDGGKIWIASSTDPEDTCFALRHRLVAFLGEIVEEIHDENPGRHESKAENQKPQVYVKFNERTPCPRADYLGSIVSDVNIQWLPPGGAIVSTLRDESIEELLRRLTKRWGSTFEVMDANPGKLDWN